MSLGLAVVRLDVTVVNVGVKAIGASLGSSVAALQWVVSAHTLALAALILTAGALGDRAGDKRMSIAGFATFTAASIACGLAPSLTVLIAARTVQGIGAAILVPCSLALLNHADHDARERARDRGCIVRLAAGRAVRVRDPRGPGRIGGRARGRGAARTRARGAQPPPSRQLNWRRA